MKSFKTLLSEVAEPKSAEEKRFKDQHTYEVIKHPVALDSQHTGEITPGQTTDKGKRAADQKGDAAYDKAYSKHGDGSTKLKEDASGMNAAQKMNFDKLYKKMNNGPEHKALKQKHGNQVKADDAFHAMVKAKAMGEDQQLTDEELSAAQKKIDINKNGKIDGHDLAMLRAKKKKTEGKKTFRDVTEGLMSALKKPVTQTGPDGKTRTVMKTTRNVNKDDRGYDKIRTNESDELSDETLEEGPFKGIGKMMMKNKLNRASKSLAKQQAANTQDKKDKWPGIAPDQVNGHHVRAASKAYDDADKRGDDILHQRKRTKAALDRLNKSPNKDVKFPFNKRNEEVGTLDEGMKFKQGNLKLKDRSSVKITKEDADKLNKLMGGLDRNNLKRMEATAVKDKKSFNEILSFAREAT